MRRSSCAIIERQGGIVAILKRKHGHAPELPGGKANGDETAEEALCREIREELGVEIVTAFPVREFDVKAHGSQETHRCTAFACEIDPRAEIRGSEEGAPVIVSRAHLLEFGTYRSTLPETFAAYDAWRAGRA